MDGKKEKINARGRKKTKNGERKKIFRKEMTKRNNKSIKGKKEVERTTLGKTFVQEGTRNG